MNTVGVILDISKQGDGIPVLRVGENDKAAPTLQASITDHGDIFPLSGYSAMFKMRKPGGGIYSRDGTVSGNVATFKLDGMQPGITDVAYVVLARGDTRLSTQRIHVEVLEGVTK